MYIYMHIYIHVYLHLYIQWYTHVNDEIGIHDSCISHVQVPIWQALSPTRPFSLGLHVGAREREEERARERERAREIPKAEQHIKHFDARALSMLQHRNDRAITLMTRTTVHTARRRTTVDTAQEMNDETYDNTRHTTLHTIIRYTPCYIR